MYRELSSNLIRMEKYQAADNVQMFSTVNQRNSYNEFIETGVYTAIENAFSQIQQGIGEDNVKIEVLTHVGKPKREREIEDYMNNRGEYIPVDLQFKINGRLTEERYRFLDIPHMDSTGVLNVKGEKKVLLGEITSMQTVSSRTYDDKGHKVTEVIVSLHRDQITFKITDKSIGVKVGKDFKQATTVVEALFYIYRSLICSLDNRSEIYTSDEIFDNSLVKLTQKIPYLTSPENSYAEAESWNIDRWARKEVSPMLRENLNKLLNFDTALDKVLSEDIIEDGQVTFTKGTRLSRAHVDYLNTKSQIFKISVKNIPYVAGSFLCEPVIIRTINRGTPISDYLRRNVPSVGNSRQVSKTIEDVEVIIPSDTRLTSEIIELMYYSEVESIVVRPSKSSEKIKTVLFKQEILSNRGNNVAGMFKIAFGRDILNPYDIAALLTYSIRVHYGDIKATFNRDKDFIKKVNLFNEVMTDGIYDTMREFYSARKYRNKINQFFRGQAFSGKNENVFRGFMNDLMRHLTANRTTLRPVDDTNPLSVLSQVNQTIYPLQNSKSVAGVLRTLALPFYGRVCPYETPQSKKIGLVNTLAIGCRVDDTIPKTQYYKLEKRKDGLYVTDEIEWLSAEEEQDHKRGCRIGDLLSLTITPEGKIEDTLTLARIPAPIESDERMSVAEVYSSTLTHINVLPEQHLSPTAMMIPFAASDDGARVTFGMSLMKQSLCLSDGDVPYVTTSMYRNIYAQSGQYLIKAEHDGELLGIEENRLIVQYDGHSQPTIINYKETTVTSLAVTITNILPNIGDRFKAGDILVDSPTAKEGFYSSGANVLVAYICDEGWNYEDAIVGDEYLQHKMTSISVDTQKERVRSKHRSPISKHSYVTSLYKYVSQGDSLIRVTNSNRADKNDAGRIDNIASEYNGIVYNAKHITNSTKDTTEVEHRVQIVDLKPLKTGDKMAGRHGNKGVKSLTKKTSEMPVFKNGEVVQVVLNPFGAVSRMNMGQALEAHLGFAGYLLDCRFETDPFNGAPTEEIGELIHYLYDVSNCAGDIDYVNSKWRSRIPTFIQNKAKERLDFIMEWEGCFDETGRAQLYNPATGTYFENPITFGVTYLIKTVQEADDKIHERAGGLAKESYSQIDKQPPKGASAGGGQRVGEMEAAAIVAHGATAVYDEFFQVKSDNTPQQINLALEMVGIEEKAFTAEECIPRGVDIFRYDLESIGVIAEISEDIYPNNNHEDILERKAYSIQDLVKALTNRDTEKQEEYTKEIKDDYQKVEELIFD